MTITTLLSAILGAFAGFLPVQAIQWTIAFGLDRDAKALWLTWFVVLASITFALTFS